MAYINKNDKIEYNRKYNEGNYDRLSVTVKKGRKNKIKQAADKTGESVNGFITRLIDAELERLGIDITIEQKDTTGDDCSNSTPPVDSSSI